MINLIFEEIVINNFLSIKEMTVQLSDRGFIVVSGINNSSKVKLSNGSGKSSIFDAIFWTLTGDTLRGTTDVVNSNHSKEGCLCKLRINDGQDSYEIVRTKSHQEYGNSLRIYVNGELVSDQIKKSQDLLSESIPTVTKPDVLGSIVLLGQGLPYRFSSFTPIKRKDFLEVLSGSSSELSKIKYRLDIIESEYKDRSEKASSDNSKILGNIDGLEETIRLLEEQVNSQKSKEEIDSLRSSTEAEINSLNSKLNDVRSDRDSLGRKLELAIELRSSSESYLSTLNSSLSSIRGQLSGIKQGNCPICGRPFEVDDHTKKTVEVLNSKESEFSKQVTIISEKISGLKSEESRLGSLIKGCDSQEISINYDLSDRKNLIESLNAESVKVDEVRSRITSTKDKITSLIVRRKSNEDAISDSEEYLEGISYLKRQISRDFKGYVLSEIIKFLSERSEYYGNLLFSTGDTLSVKLDGNKINIYVGSRQYENLSGGERQRADLAVQFALRDMLMVTTGFSCNLIILDEAFDNLDSQGSESLIKTVVSEFSDIDSVFIITHHSEINIPYDEEIVVVKGSNGDTVLQ